jgi:hypothetical protein
MHANISLLAFSWLTLGGTMQIILLIFRSLRGQRNTDGESTFYYGHVTSFAFGQILYGLFGLLLIFQAPYVMHRAQFVTLTTFALCGWFAIDLFLLHLQKPKFTTLIFGLLLIVFNLVNL